MVARRLERASRELISEFMLVRVLERARFWARSAGRAVLFEVCISVARVVRVLERWERRASFWGFGGIGGAGAVDWGVAGGRGVSKGEVRRSVGGGFFGWGVGGGGWVWGCGGYL